MPKSTALVLAAIVTLPLHAQESMWIANRQSSDIMEVSLCGQLLNTVPVGTNLRRLKVAPDGKIWVIKFIQPTFDIRNPDGSLFLTLTAAMGNPYDVAFDASGHAWVSGGTGVEEFDANGVSLATYPMPAAAPLGITIDVAGNKWIAHRIAAPGSVSRIDGATGVVTNHVLPANSTIQPTTVLADSRLFGSDSHIWVVGDGGNTLAEFDINGNALNAYNVGVTGLSSLAVSPSGDIYAGNFSNGQIHRVDPSSGAVLNTFFNAPATLGVAFDSFGRLWATARNPTPSLSEVRRLNPATGALEVPVVLGLGTQSSISTGFDFAFVVDPQGDADGDGEPNLIEILNGTSPYDAQSNSAHSLLAAGPTSIGSTFTLSIAAAPSTITGLAVAASSLPPPGLGFGGVGGVLWLDPGTIFYVGASPFLFILTGSAVLPVAIPNDPGVAGTVLHAQGLSTTVTGASFTNATCIRAY